MSAPVKTLLAVLAVVSGPVPVVWAWGPEGHSIIAEVAQHRLSPEARAEVDRLLGTNHSLASVASWADDVRQDRVETNNWHFVGIPLAESHYDAAKHCKPTEKGDCVVGELERLKTELRCAATDALKAEALRYTVHFIGDIHQPLRTVEDARGGTDIAVEVRLVGAKPCNSGLCSSRLERSNFHAVWDSTLIKVATGSWGAYVDRLEDGWLTSQEAQNVDGGTPVAWAEETHREARYVWDQLSENRVVDDAYYGKVLPSLDRQLGLAGLRTAKFLNQAYETGVCSRAGTP